MKTVLVIIVVVALLVVGVGAVNYTTEIELDYIAGSTAAVSLLWIALGVAAALFVAVLLGWAAGKGSEAAARRKLERELEATYRRLRESEAQAPRPSATVGAATEVAPGVGDAATVPATVVTPAPAETPGVASAVSDEPSASHDASS